jgi:pimeloyl-ACP methyl ester carboxylesterase
VSGSPRDGLLAGFEPRALPTSRGIVNAMVGGSGPPLLLLHGYPESLLMWHATAPLLAEHHTVVATDLAGYGASFRPAPWHDHSAHGKRALAHDQVEAMAQLGFASFAVAGHDRGGRVAYRMALDHPERVRLAVLDIVPTGGRGAGGRRGRARVLALGVPRAPGEPAHDRFGTLERLVHEGLQRPPQRRHAGGRSLGEPRRHSVQDEVDRALRSRCRGRGDGGQSGRAHAGGGVDATRDLGRADGLEVRFAR